MSWAEISQNTPTSAEKVGNQLIWNNRFIKVDHKPIFYSDLGSQNQEPLG